jgi:hypothetical protein
MPDRDDAALRDVHWKMYQENWTQARHHENQCLELARLSLPLLAPQSCS